MAFVAGQKFAMLEIKSTLSYILRCYQINPVVGFEPILYNDGVLKSKNGILVQLAERQW